MGKVFAVWFLLVVILQALGVEIVAAVLISILVMAGFFILLICRPGKKSNPELDAEISAIKEQMQTACDGELTFRAFVQSENQVKNNIEAALLTYGVRLNDLQNTSSSLGYCAYINDYLLASVEFRSQSPNMIYTDPYQFLQNHRSIKERYTYIERAIEKAANLGDDEYLSLDNAKMARNYINVVTECARHPVRISSMRVFSKSNIVYYKVDGLAQYVSEVKGGGVNLGGAILGGVIAGGAGAVVGSRVGTEIKTDIVKEERRKLLLYYYDNGVLRSEQIITSNIDYVLSLLRKWIPDKEFDYVMLNGGVV